MRSRRFALIYWGIPAVLYLPAIPYFVRVYFAPVAFLLPLALLLAVVVFALFVRGVERAPPRGALGLLRQVIVVTFAASFVARCCSKNDIWKCVQLVGFFCNYAIIAAGFVKELRRLRATR
jgi:hypothetical protein